MTVQYVRPDGSYVGGFGDGALPTERDAYPVAVKDLINIGEDAPEYADQIFLFPGWAPSNLKQTAEENLWRAAEMPKAQQNVTAIEYGEEGIPGTSQQWQKYWLALRKWANTNPDFPDRSKRPVAPT